MNNEFLPGRHCAHCGDLLNPQFEHPYQMCGTCLFVVKFLPGLLPFWLRHRERVRDFETWGRP